MQRSRILTALVFLVSVWPAPVLPQPYPSQPLQLVIPFPPGGVVDIMGRGFAQAMDRHIGQRVVVINRPGGGLTVGMTAAVRAAADGYTVLYSPVTPITIQTHRMKGLGFGKDSFVPVCQTFENLFFVAASPKSPLIDFRALLEFAKAHPGKLRYATPGVASSPHLAGAELWRQAGVDLTDIAYSGEIAALPHLLSGELDLGIITTSGVASAKLRPLAIFASERIKEYPETPTVRELGYPILPSGYGGLFVRVETPAPIISRLETACRDATADAEYKELAARQFQRSDYLDRAAFTARLDADHKSKAVLIPSLKLPE